MKAVLYEPAGMDYRYNGIGVLSDEIRADVETERNGVYVADLEYPTNGIWSEYLLPNYIVKMAANDTDDLQLFRIQNVINTNKGTKRVKLNHISYDLVGRPVKPYSANGAAAAVAGIETNALIPTGFTFETDLTGGGQYSIPTPRSARAVLGGTEGSLIDVYGGELRFDNYKVSLLTRLGSDNGVSVRYGKNLTDLSQELDSSEACNGILPYWYTDNDGLVMPTTASTTNWDYGYNNYKTMDLTDQFDSKPTATQLKNLADTLITPGLSQTLEVSFVSLYRLKEFEVISVLEKVALGDTVAVIYPQLNLNVKTRVVKTTYDSLTERYKSIELGTHKTTIADIIIKEGK